MNAQTELLAMLDSTKIGRNPIKCALITFGEDKWEKHRFELHVNYTDQEYQEFMSGLNFDYHDGYGGQIIFGHVWFNDGTWLDRGEYDGSEWWEHRVMPVIPDSLLIKDIS